MQIHELVQGSPEWAAFRLNHFGASEAAAMLGLSKKVTRSELLRMKHTGEAQQFSNWVQANILDYGHEVEARARPLIEEMIGEDLYPVTCSDGRLSASCDGLTLAGDTAFEHKQWNTALAESVDAGVLPDEHWPQCQQILMVTGAERVIFTVSDGTEQNLTWTQVLPDPAWFERLRAGWAQFQLDLDTYTPPAAQPVIVAEAVQTLPAVTIQVSGQISVRENFHVFEAALREFLGNRLIREPKTDQDFADLDVQIKAMKKAEEALNAAEAMMLAQIQSVDEAKRQKDLLAKLVRDNRLMAEKLLESEKSRRRAECIDAVRQAFAAHVAELQREISSLRLDVPQPDFVNAIKGLKTLTSIQDKLDTALANGKITADQCAAELRQKLSWVDANAGEHLALLPDLQQLSSKPLDDFKLAITARIEAHQKAEEARLASERERIRQEENARLEREMREASTPPVAVAQPETVAAPAPTAQNNQRSTSTTPAAGSPTLRLGQINERLSPIQISADGLEALGFKPAAIEKNARLYHEHVFQDICTALIAHIEHAARLTRITDTAA